MKVRVAAACALLLTGALVARFAFAAGEAPPSMEAMMAEMSKCEVCKSMLEHPHLLHSMEWETHKIDNGMISVCTAPHEHLDEYKAMSQSMMKKIDGVKSAMMKGDKVELCHYCQNMAELMKAGAKQKEIMTKSGSVELVTSDKPEVIKQIHAQADESIAMQKEIDKMKAAMVGH